MIRLEIFSIFHIFAILFMNTIERIQKWCNGSWLASADSSAIIDSLDIDSRNIEHPATSLFIALKTPIRDGHSYIPDAWQKGVRNFLVSNDMDLTSISGANFIQVKDTLTALQQVAAGHRKQFKMPVIGITGSNGKTMVKEWLNQLLSSDYNIVRSPKSYNSQVGVPLSV